MALTKKTTIIDFLKCYPDGRIPSLDIQRWCKENMIIPMRTFQWYTEEELLPTPKVIEGKFHYYTPEEVLNIVAIIGILRVVRRSSSVRLGSLKRILKKNKYSVKVISFLQKMVQMYPIIRYDEEIDEACVSPENADIWRIAIERIEKGVEVENIKLTDIEEERVQK